jgi:tetratricopeptide (TPR) repeat protein
MSDEKNKTKAQALADMDQETKLDAVEKDLADKSEEEVMAALEKAGGSKESAEALFAKQDAMLAAALAKAKAKTQTGKAKALREMIVETNLDAIEKDLDGKTDDEVMAALEKAGGSRESAEALFAKQDAMLEEALQKAKPTNVRDITTARRWRPRNVIAASFGGGVAFVATMQFLLMSFGVMFAGVGAMPVTQTGPTYAAPDSGAESESAQDFRYKGLRAFALGDYADCIRLFDEAKALDPMGDSDLAVKNARVYSLRFIAMAKEAGRP